MPLLCFFLKVCDSWLIDEFVTTLYRKSIKWGLRICQIPGTVGRGNPLSKHCTVVALNNVPYGTDLMFLICSIQNILALET